MERRLAAMLAAVVVGYLRLMGADEEGKDERMQTFRIAALAVILAAGLTVQGGAQDYQGYISGGGDTFTTNPGIPVVIYGQRGKCHGKEAPTFAALMESKGITQAPRHGTLSDGGTGKRMSQNCGKAVPVRVVIYTPDPNFVGEDSVEFWGTDVSAITVVARYPAAVMAQTSVPVRVVIYTPDPNFVGEDSVD